MPRSRRRWRGWPGRRGPAARQRIRSEALPLGRSTGWAPPASDGRSADDPEAAAPVAHALAGRVSPAAAPDAQDSPPRRSPVPAAPRDPNPPPAGGASEAGPVADAPHLAGIGRAAVGRRTGSRTSRVGWGPGTAVGRSCPGTACIRTGRGSAPAANTSGRELGPLSAEVPGRCAPSRSGSPDHRLRDARPRCARTRDDPTPLSPADDPPERRPNRFGQRTGRGPRRDASPDAVGGEPRRARRRPETPGHARRPMRAAATGVRATRGRERGHVTAGVGTRTRPLSAADAAAPRSESGCDPGALSAADAAAPRVRVGTRARRTVGADAVAPRSSSGREPGPLSAADAAAPRSASGRNPGARRCGPANPASSRSGLRRWTSPRERGRRCAERLPQPGALRTRAPSKGPTRRPRLLQPEAAHRRADPSSGRRRPVCQRRCAPALRPWPRRPRPRRPPDPPHPPPRGRPRRASNRSLLRTRRTAWRIGTRRGFADTCLADVDHHGRLGVGTVVGAAPRAHPPEFRFLRPCPFPSLWVTKNRPMEWKGPQRRMVARQSRTVVPRASRRSADRRLRG